LIKSVLRGEKLMYKCHKEKNQHATSITNKHQNATSFMSKN